MPSALDMEFARRFREMAVERFGDELEEVRIFGSRARGDFRRDSDLDLFVLHRTDDPNLRRAFQDMAWELASEMEMPYWPSPHVMSHAHFQRLVDLERRIARDILEEGLPV